MEAKTGCEGVRWASWGLWLKGTHGPFTEVAIAEGQLSVAMWARRSDSEGI